MTGYTRSVKTAISVPDPEFERYEQVARRHGMNRSEFYRAAAARLADELEGARELTAIANAVIERVGQPVADREYLARAAGVIEGVEW